MPEMHGLEVVRRAKELDADLAIIVITALVDVKHAIQALRIGADDYVLKRSTSANLFVRKPRHREAHPRHRQPPATTKTSKPE